MKKIKQKGFVLIIVIMVVAIVGLELFVLAGGSNTILFQTDTAYLQAVERNLVVSGLAWTKRNIKDEGGKILDKAVELDITGMDVRSATLSVIISAPSNEEKEIQINTSCSRARQTKSSKNKLRIGL